MMDWAQRIMDGLEASRKKQAAVAAGQAQGRPAEEVIAQIKDAPAQEPAEPAMAVASLMVSAKPRPTQNNPRIDIEPFIKRLDRISQRIKFGDRK